MGFDVTFHPVALEELQRFVFDVVDAPKLAAERARELVRSKSKQKDVLEYIYDEFAGWNDDLARPTAAGDTDPPTVANTFAYAAAALAGYRHPYWYSRNAAIGFLVEIEPRLASLFRPLPSLATGRLARHADPTRGLLTRNYSGSGFIAPEELPRLSELLDALAKSPTKKKHLAKVFDTESLDALERAIAHARSKGLGLIEAADVVVPMNEENLSDEDNFRAHFMGNP